jgi:hypothetical protein
MSGRDYASRKAAMIFEPFPPFEDRSFRVLDGKGNHLESFGIFKAESGKWGWQEASPQS